MGHLAMDTFWEQTLHQNTAVIFNLTLSHMDRVVVTTVPYQIHHRTAEEIKEDEEAQETVGIGDLAVENLTEKRTEENLPKP
jgi:hypothetical protein